MHLTFIIFSSYDDKGRIKQEARKLKRNFVDGEAVQKQLIFPDVSGHKFHLTDEVIFHVCDHTLSNICRAI